MWTSERNSRRTVEEPGAEMGQVTLGGTPAGVNLGGERRWMPLCSPGGYSWRPAVGEKVLVLKAGAERESPCILGTVRETEELAPGEVRLTGKGCSISMPAGRVEINGEILVNGMTLDDYIEMIVVRVLSQMLG